MNNIMKTFKFLMPFLLVAFTLVGCDNDDLRNDIDELKNRVESLEAQVSTFNDNINALKVLIDGKITIQEVKVKDGVYTLLLSNEQTITLKQGEDFSAPQEPQVSIENGNWVINGTDTGCPVAGDVPEFRIENNYWEVKIDGNWQRVKDANGNDVMAVSDGTQTGGNSFFESVVYDEAKGVLNIVLKEGSQQLTLPVVQNLVCAIDKSSLKNNTLVVGYGKTATLEVTIKGDNAFVTAPSGWLATLSEPNTEGKATLTVKAPAKADASAMSRATADNSKDLTVQVNKGVNWAVDKIQVEAGEVIESYYALYESEGIITIGDISISKAIFGEAVLVETDKTITTEQESTGIYFVKPGVTLEYSGTTSSKNLIVIGDNESDKTASFKLSSRLNLNMGQDPALNQGYYIWKNIKFDASNLESACMSAYRAYDGSQDKAIIIDDCEVSLPSSGKNFLELTTDGRYFNKFIIKNSKIHVSKNMSFALTKTSTATNKSDKFGEMVVENNFVYSKTPLSNVKFFNGQEVKIRSISLKNNTLVNLPTTTSGYFYATVNNNIDCVNNIIYSESIQANQVVIRLINNDDTFSGTCNNNYIYSGVSEFTWQLFFSGKMPVSGGEQANKLTESPFSNLDLDNGNFTLLPEYSDCGATID